MKIHIARYDPLRTGGGWSFQRNFGSLLGEALFDYPTANIYFITSPSMLERKEVEQAKQDGKKIVLRIDNAVRNSRNRNTGMTRMYDFAQMADLIVYQSNWAKDYLEPFLGKHNSTVILNGVDLNVYNPGNRVPNNRYLYSRFNRDETKNWEVARYTFSRIAEHTPDAELFIVGQFSDELRNGNFDFYNQERFRYFGVVNEESMAELYRNCQYFIYTYYNDACSNSLIEALVSGCDIAGDDYYRQTGGATEIMNHFIRYGGSYFSKERMVEEYMEALEKL